MYGGAVALTIDINAFGLEPPKNIQYEFMISTLQYLDSITYNYPNAENFFKEKYSKILDILQHTYKKYGMQLAPTAIEMGPKKICIVKSDETKIQPLFQTINKDGNVYSLEDLIKKRMYNGNLKMLYECDKEQQSDPDYISIFSDIPSIILQKLEVNLLEEKDIELFLQNLKENPEYLSLARLLLLKHNDEDKDRNLKKREIYQLEIERLAKNAKVDHLKDEIANRHTRLYRFPYKD